MQTWQCGPINPDLAVLACYCRPTNAGQFMQTDSCRLGHANNLERNAGTANAFVAHLQLHQVIQACT